MRTILPVLAAGLVTRFSFPGAPTPIASHSTVTIAPIDSAVPNDNRRAAGTLRNGVLNVALEARTAGWRPDKTVDSLVTIRAFGEAGKQTSIPGPLIRARAGTEISVTLTNTFAGVPLLVTGMRPGLIGPDTLQVAPGASRTVRFIARSPGTFLYWGTTDIKAGGPRPSDREGRDAQLTGIIVIDPATGSVDRDERIFVMTLIDIVPDTLKKTKEDIWELAINGRSWPHTERLRHSIGDTVRWRWVNGTDRSHPMHLHGFHFRVTAKGNGDTDSVYTTANSRLAVTEHMPSGSTFAMEWVPLRAGNWLMHCHMVPHITPYPDRVAGNKAHDLHDVARHPEQSMAGLVLGITTVEPKRLAFWRSAATPLSSAGDETALRLFAQQGKVVDGKKSAKGYVLQRGAEPARDSIEVPGSSLVLTKGRTTRITVVNRLAEPTTVHWHGIELQSIYDGVSGWSGAGKNVAPLLAPGDSFSVVITPPRAGTYMYHTHMDEEAQLNAGMYGALIVLEPGKKFDRGRDLVFIHGQSVHDGNQARAINGLPVPPALSLHTGGTYRLRLINLLPAASARVSLTSGVDTLIWRKIAKDGADLPPGQNVSTAQSQLIGVGEAYDYEWTPARPIEVMLNFLVLGAPPVRQKIVVLDAQRP